MGLGKFLEMKEFCVLLSALIEEKSIQALVGASMGLRCWSVPLERAIVELVATSTLDHLMKSPAHTDLLY